MMIFIPIVDAAAQDALVDRDAAQIFRQLCATCHGENLEGGRAQSMSDNAWRYGGDDASLARNIREGITATGMPGFGEVLSEREIRTLVVFIQETVKNQVAPMPKESRALPVGTVSSEEHAYRVEMLVDGLDVPWSIVLLPDGRLLFTERTGGLFIVQPDGTCTAVADVPPVWVRDEGGLMALALHPDYGKNGWIYLSFADPGPDDTGMLKVIRARLHEGRLTDHETIFQAPPEAYTSSGMGFGSRFVFDGDYLFFSVGDRGARAEAQDLTKPNGKIHRVYHDGSIPPDNPFAEIPGAVLSIWSYGLRNPQGLARDPVTGDLWETEHGPRGGDELNLIRRGANYGWPVVTHGMNYNGTPISDRTEQAGMEPPVRHWTPSLAVSPIHFYTGDKFPRWRNQLFLGSLGAQQFRRFVVEGDRIVHEELVFKDLGRVRDILTGPDGFLYLSLELPGAPSRIVRLVPEG